MELVMELKEEQQHLLFPLLWLHLEVDMDILHHRAQVPAVHRVVVLLCQELHQGQDLLSLEQ
jgi:hypothetical protein